MTCMNITIRNLQDSVFRQFKAKAAEEDMKLGDALTQAMQLWLSKKTPKPKGKLIDLKRSHWGKGTENTSQEIDKIVYG
jgi:hypothetical protein